MIIILIGLPGCGKGTQGSFLATKLGIPVISTGEVIRKMLKDDQEAAAWHSDVSQGKLLPSSLINKFMAEFLARLEYRGGCILDGYPRSLEQANFLATITDRSKVKVIYFKIAEQLVIKRILARFSCDDCGTIYNRVSQRLKIENICDICQSANFNYRKDDNLLVVSQRIKEYHAETQPVLKYYQDRPGFYVVDASRSVQSLKGAIEQCLS